MSWACNVDGTPFVVAGGINGVMRVIDVGSEKIHKVFYLFSTELIMLYLNKYLIGSTYKRLYGFIFLYKHSAECWCPC